jgi:hypothetical protein
MVFMAGFLDGLLVSEEEEDEDEEEEVDDLAFFATDSLDSVSGFLDWQNKTMSVIQR